MFGKVALVVAFVAAVLLAVRRRQELKARVAALIIMAKNRGQQMKAMAVGKVPPPVQPPVASAQVQNTTAQATDNVVAREGFRNDWAKTFAAANPRMGRRETFTASDAQYLMRPTMGNETLPGQLAPGMDSAEMRIRPPASMVSAEQAQRFAGIFSTVTSK
jgi:hypothetical protein